MPETVPSVVISRHNSQARLTVTVVKLITSKQMMSIAMFLFLCSHICSFFFT
jgi:hypothetical protein